MKKTLTEEQKKSRAEYQKAWREANKENLAEWHREYRKNNPEVNKINTKAYRERHPDKAKESSKNYKANNKEKIKKAAKDYQPKRAELEKIKKETDPLYKLKANIRSGIKKAFYRINARKNNKTVEILGCSYEEFKQHIESLFELWMTWDNHGLYNGELNHGWDIDHIIPISSAKTVEEIIKLNHFTNLRPLCSKTNRDIKRNNPTN